MRLRQKKAPRQAQGFKASPEGTVTIRRKRNVTLFR